MAKRGRPAFKPTAKQRRSVEQMVSVGEPIATIARALGIAENTLRQHFAEELENGWAKRRLEVTDLLYANARKGNVSAQKHLEHMTAVAATASLREPEQAKDPKAPKLGKKDQAAADARQPDTESVLGDLIAKRQATLN
jgi:predicted transcriptional regulator